MTTAGGLASSPRRQAVRTSARCHASGIPAAPAEQAAHASLRERWLGLPLGAAASCPVLHRLSSPTGREQLISLAIVAALVAACAATSGGPSASSPAPSALASPAVVCDTTQFQPTPSLTCGPARRARRTRPAHPPISREEFRYGGLCPPDAPCAPPLGDAGIVIVTFASGPAVFVYVQAAAGGVVTVSSPAPYPSGY